MRKISRKMTINSGKLKSSLKYILNGSEKFLLLEVGNHTIKMCEYVFNNGLIHVLNGFIIPTPQNAVENDKIVNVPAIVKVIQDKIRIEHITNRTLTVSIASNEIITREMLVPKIKHEEMSKFIEVNSGDIFPVKLNTYSLGYSVIEEYKDKGTDMNRIMIAAIPKDVIIPYIELAATLKLQLKNINFSGFELYNFIDFEIDDKEEGYAVVDVGAKNTNLVIVSKGVFRFNRVINRGSDEITKKIEEELQCNSVKAEHLKRKYNSVIILGNLKKDSEVYKVAEITQDIISDIMQNVFRVLEFYNINNPKNRISKVYLTGLGSKISGIEEFIEGILGFPVVRIKELQKVRFDNNAKRLRNRQLTFVNCLGATNLANRNFVFIKGDLQLSNFMLFIDKNFYKAVACVILLVLLVAAGINFNIYLINQETDGYNSFISSKVEITQLQDKIAIENGELDKYKNIVNEIGTGAEKYKDKLEIIENVIKDMSKEVDIYIDKYKFNTNSIEITCRAAYKRSEDEMAYINAPYNFEDKLSQYFECSRGRNTKSENFVITLKIK